MNLLFRILLTLVVSGFKSRLGVLDVSRVRFRVWPNDLDLNLHMNNGRYLSLMDLGRFDLILRAGFVRVMMKRRWYPLVGTATIRFLKSLDPFMRYELETQILSWDEKWWYIEQRFVHEGRLMAVGMIKGLFRGPKGNVRPAEVLEAVGVTTEAPPLPEHVLRMLAMEEARREPRDVTRVSS